jgi:hypothetical protein
MERMAKGELLLNAASRALKTSYFHRTGGAEKQAGVELKNYRPKDGLELIDHYGEVIDFLLSVNEPDKELAEEVLIEKFNQQYSEGNAKKAYMALKEIIKRRGLTQNIREHLTHLISFGGRINPEQKAQLIEILNEHEPKGIKQQLQIKVIGAPYENVKTDSGYKNVSEEKAREFARELIESKNYEWLNNLDILQQNEQRQTFSFAHELGKLVEDRKSIIDIALDELAGIQPKEQNDTFIRGFIWGINDEEFTRNVIDQLIQLSDIKQHSFRLSQSLHINQHDLNKLIKLCNEDIDLIIGFQYLNYKSLNTNEVIRFLEWLSSKNKLGVWLAIGIIERLIDEDLKNFNEYKDLIKELITIKGITITQKTNPSSLYQYEILAKKLLDGGLEDEYVIKITNEILLTCSQYSMVGENHLSSIFHHLLDKYWDVSWSIVGNAILNLSIDGWYGLKTLLERYDRFEEDKILDWVEKNLPRAAIIAMMFIQFENREKEEWNPIILILLDKYGSNETMLKELSARMHSFTAIGSAIPIFESRKKLLEKLLHHPNERVKKFAEIEIDHFNKSIEREKIWSQNHELGEY